MITLLLRWCTFVKASYSVAPPEVREPRRISLSPTLPTTTFEISFRHRLSRVASFMGT